MLKFRLLISAFLIITVVAGCNKESKKQAGEEENVKPSRVPEAMVPNEEKPDKERILGIWSQPDKPFWLEFNADGTYSSGRGPEIYEENLEWSINEETKILTLNSRKGIRNIGYRFEANEVYFIREGKSKEKLFIRLHERPAEKE